MGKGAASKDPEAGKSSPCIEKRIEVMELESAEAEARLRMGRMSEAVDGAAERLQKQQERIDGIGARLARAREELGKLEKDAAAHEIPGAVDQGKGDHEKDHGAGDQGTAACACDHPGEGGRGSGRDGSEGSAPGAGCGPVPEQHAGIAGDAGGKERRRSPSAGDWDAGRGPDDGGRDEGSGDDAGAGGLPPMREPGLLNRRPDGTQDFIAGRWASMAESDIAVRRNMDSVIARLR